MRPSVLLARGARRSSMRPARSTPSSPPAERAPGPGRAPPSIAVTGPVACDEESHALVLALRARVSPGRGLPYREGRRQAPGQEAPARAGEDPARLDHDLREGSGA